MSENGENIEGTTQDFLAGLLLALVLTLLSYFVLPMWQIIVPIGIIAGLKAKSGKKGFFAGLGGVVIGWGLLLGTQSAFSPIAGSAKLLSQIMGLGGSVWWLIIVLTLIIGGLIGGFSGLVGAYVREMIEY